MTEILKTTEQIEDKRQEKKVRHKLLDIVVIVLFAKLANEDDWEEVEISQSRGVYFKQGVKGPDQYKYDSYPGGNGTYIIGVEYYGTVLNVKIFVYDIERCVTFDVYDDILAIAGRKKYQQNYFQQ